jgi:hypothetical protein
MKWEHKVIRLPQKGFTKSAINDAEAERQLDELGRLGWELVAVLREPMSEKPIAFLKRGR